MSIKSLPDKFFISLFILMNGIGLIAYFIGVDFYRVPSSVSLELMVVLCISFILAWLFFTLYIRTFRFERFTKDDSKSGIYLTDLGLVLSFLVVFIYLILNKESFVFWMLLSGLDLDESVRPDVVGNVPFYWTFTVILASFAIPLALNEVLVNSGFKKIFWLFTLLFFSILLGDKSTILVIVFFIIFFVNKASWLKILLFVFTFLFVYVFVKYLYHSSTHQVSDILDFTYLVESIFRRVAMINISTMGVVLDNFVFSNIGNLDGFTHIKQYVFFQIYGYLPGGAPIPFIVSDLYKLPVVLMPLFVFVISFFIFLSRFYLLAKANRRIYYVILYLQFYGAIVIVSGSLFDYMVRSFIPSILIILSSYILVYRFKKRSNA